MAERQTLDLNKFLLEEIRNKYDFFEKGNFETISNMSIDSLFPKLFYKKIANERITSTESTYNTSSFAISEFCANTMGVRKAHISELCGVLGFSEQRIKRILLDVKRKRLNLFLVGFGGTGANFNYWLKELCEWTHTVNIFERIIVNDNDSFTLSNIMRIPFDYRIKNTGKEKRYNFDNSANLASSIIPASGDRDAVNHAVMNSENFIYYGAPDIPTRAALSEMNNVKFISATHSGDSAQLYLRPPQDDTLQIETYGRINLSVFFMNHLNMTVRFLEFLTNYENINWNMSGEIMDYNFKKAYNNEELPPNSRLYRFPCLTREEMDALREANNAEIDMPDNDSVEEAAIPIPQIVPDIADISEHELNAREILEELNEEARI